MGRAPTTPDTTNRTYAPRGMRRDTAAWYTGFSATKFDELVADGAMPKGKMIAGCRVWDRVKLDRALDALLDDDSAPANSGWGEFTS
jgi:hypothetical protein